MISIDRHVELSSSITNTKFVFTVIKYGSMSQGKIGFNNLQVNILKKIYFYNKKIFFLNSATMGWY